MKLRASRHLPCFVFAAVVAFAPLAVAEEAPGTGGQDHTMGGEMMGGMGGGQGHTMGGMGSMGGGQGHMMGGMGGGQGHMMGGTGGMGGGQGHMMGGMNSGQDHTMGGMGGGEDPMARIMSMMHDKLAHASDRVASLKTALKITEAQTPAWDKLASALVTAAKTTIEQSMEAMRHEMMQRAAPAQTANPILRDYPDFNAVKKIAPAEAAPASALDLPTRLARQEKMLKLASDNLQAINDALTPLYATLSDEQKKIADGLRIGPMGAM